MLPKAVSHGKMEIFLRFSGLPGESAKMSGGLTLLPVPVKEGKKDGGEHAPVRG
jgi:hypothetical protein